MRHIALLRGINIGRHNRVTMSNLRNVFSRLGFLDVKTYLQSGNIAFESVTNDHFDTDIKEAIETDLKLQTPVILRSQAEIVQAVASQPFSGSLESYHVTFLTNLPSGNDIDYDIQSNGEDKWQLIGREVFLFIPGNYSDSRLTNAYFERNLNSTATTRNWKTVIALSKL
jgi:uncharacterized protein (DUF1697 family)